MKRMLMALIAAAALAPRPALAHELWLSPSTYRAARGDTVALRVLVGTGFRGEVKPYAPSRTLRFALRAQRDLDLARAARNGDRVMARFVAADAGGALVAYESRFADIELGGAEFDRYLAEEGLDHARALRARAPASAPVRERYARCPKTWIAGGDANRATRPAGLAYELVPERDPSAAGALTMRALFKGRPLAGALVRAWNRPLASGFAPVETAARDAVPPVVSARTDARGRVVLRLEGPGEWMIASVHMIPSPDRTQADWESYWASLTFARRP